MPEDLSIPDDPDIPASNEHHFSEEGLPKTPSSIKDQMSHGVTRRPINLQIVPNSDTKVAIKEQMIPCFPSLQRTKDTVYSILQMPMPPIHHVLGVQPVHNKHPSKKFDFHCTRGLPDPSCQRVERCWCKSMWVKQLWWVSLGSALPKPNILGPRCSIEATQHGLENSQIIKSPAGQRKATVSNLSGNKSSSKELEVAK